MMLQEEPDDFVIATGESHTVEEFVDSARRYVIGQGHEPAEVVTDVPEFYRPAEVDYLLGLPEKAKKKLGWEPKVKFWELVHEMVREGQHAESIHRV